MIPIQHEDVEELRKWGLGLEGVVEKCELCATPTRHWHIPSNTPVCPQCANTRTVAELRKIAARL